jgi:hypothetical protein
MKPIMETASFKQETSCNRQRNRHIPIGLVLQACRPSHMDVAVKRNTSTEDTTVSECHNNGAEC